MHLRKSYDKLTEHTEIHVPRICLPQDLPTVYYCYTQKSNALPGGPTGGLPSLYLTTKGSWMHIGGGSPSLSLTLWCQIPDYLWWHYWQHRSYYHINWSI